MCLLHRGLSYTWTCLDKMESLLLQDVSTSQGPELYLDLSGQQEPLLFLDVSTPQWHELHLDLSGQQEPFLLQDVFSHTTLA